MSGIHIITDSCANILRAHSESRITVVPNRITIAGKTYREGVDISHEEAVKLIHRSKTPPVVTPPGEADFAKAYSNALRESSAIISIHASREIYASWYNAKKAAQPLSAHTPLAVIDSQSICMAQGLLVETALQMASKDVPFESLVRRVRGAIERIYAVYYTESLDFLLASKILAPSHGILGAMLSIKPFLTLENGMIVPIEKVRSRAQAIDRLVEFSIEFDNLEEAVILQNRSTATETTRILQERLGIEFEGREFPVSVMTPSMVALIGTDSSGLVVMEKEGEQNGVAKD